MANNVEKILKILRYNLPLMRTKYHVNSLEIFGSYIRGEQKTNSDIDLLVTFYETPGLLKFIELENFLTDLLHVKVDLVMKDSLKPRLSKDILKETQPV